MLQLGQVLQERYQLKQQLGQNSGRQTWLAEDVAKHPPELVIVKLLAFGEQVQWDNLKLFEREANVLKQLNHRRIPKYRDYFSIDDRILWFALVQDYIPGSSLKDFLVQGQKFSEKEVRKIATNVLQILVYLHELSPALLHRDIKPSNLILGQDEKIYLVDFGAVQDRAASEGATFTVVGTYGYAPMEQFGGRAVPASDLYALGATLIHLLTGTAPADLPQRNLRIQFSHHVSLSPNFVNWIEALTEPDVEQRFSTARQALEALNNGNTSNSSLLVSKPHGSRIQLKKSSSQLEIKILGRGIQASDTFFIFWLILWYGPLILMTVGSSPNLLAFLVGLLNPFLLIFWVAGLFPLCMVFFPAFGEIYIRFNRSSFVIEWKLLGLRYRQREGKTLAIHNVRKNYESMSVNDQPLTTVTMQAGAQEYKFGAFAPAATEVEHDWLVQEIKDWLEIKTDTDVVQRQDSRRNSISKVSNAHSTVEGEIAHWRSQIFTNPSDAHTYRNLGVALYKQDCQVNRQEAIANLKKAEALFKAKGEKLQAKLTLQLWGMMFWKYNPETVMSLYQTIDGGGGE